MSAVHGITCKTAAANPDASTGGVARPQGGGHGGEHGELVAPAVAGDEESGEIEVQEEAADLKAAPAPIRPQPAIVE